MSRHRGLYLLSVISVKKEFLLPLPMYQW